MESLILLLLIILNGLFAMAEIAIISSRKTKLKHLADRGDLKAQKALELANNPNRFLATVQVGITFIGIFAGAFGGETIAEAIAPVFGEGPALLLVVVVITYLSLVIGELVPKRIALSNPEGIASIMARPMQVISTVTSPLIRLLGASTDALLGLLGVKPAPDATVSEEEVRMLIQEGARRGVFNLVERDIVERTFLLGDKKVTALMTPRKEIKWLDIDASPPTVHKFISKYPYSYYPVCQGTLDKVMGVIRAKEVLTHYLKKGTLDVPAHVRKPILVPESTDSLRVLEMFKKSGIHVVLVVDEYGSIVGLLSLTDVLEAIVGDIPTVDEPEEQTMVKREDGSYLVDGLVMLDEFKETFALHKVPGEKSGLFHTVGGLVVHNLGAVPKSGDAFNLGTMRIEVVDMDGNRVDKVLVSPKRP